MAAYKPNVTGKNLDRQLTTVLSEPTAAARTTIAAIPTTQIANNVVVNADVSTAAAIAATKIAVAADATNGIVAGDLQVVLSALAARIAALEALP